MDEVRKCNKDVKDFPVKCLQGKCGCECANNVPLISLDDRKEVGRACVVGVMVDGKPAPVYLIPGGHCICEMHQDMSESGK